MSFTAIDLVSWPTAPLNYVSSCTKKQSVYSIIYPLIGCSISNNLLHMIFWSEFGDVCQREFIISLCKPLNFLSFEELRRLDSHLSQFQELNIACDSAIPFVTEGRQLSIKPSHWMSEHFHPLISENFPSVAQDQEEPPFKVLWREVLWADCWVLCAVPTLPTSAVHKINLFFLRFPACSQSLSLNGIACSAIPFLTAGTLLHPPTTHLFGILQLVFQVHPGLKLIILTR